MLLSAARRVITVSCRATTCRSESIWPCRFATSCWTDAICVLASFSACAMFACARGVMQPSVRAAAIRAAVVRKRIERE